MNANPFLMIWVHPKATIRGLVHDQPLQYVPLLAAAGGFQWTISTVLGSSWGAHLPLFGAVAGAVLLGPLIGLFQIWILAFLMEWTGRLLGGTGQREGIIAAVAWPNVASLFLLPLWLVYLPLLSRDAYADWLSTLTEHSWLWFSLAVELTLGCWSFVILVLTVTEIQRYGSLWQGLLNVLLGSFALGAALVLYRMWT